MMYEFECVWAILLLLVMERVCCLQQQFDIDLMKLPHGDDYTNPNTPPEVDNDDNLRASFIRLYYMMHVCMLLAYFLLCDLCLWFILSKRDLPRINAGRKYHLLLTL